jgi:hypothetical protein
LPPPSDAPIAIPCYSTFALNAASNRQYPVDDSTGAGVILLRSTAFEHPAIALWDTGAEGNFASWHWIERHKLQSQVQPSKQRVKYADGSVREARGELTLPLRLLTRGRGYECKLRVIVADLQPRFDLVLGTPFCKAHQPRPDWEHMTIELPEPRRDGSIAWRAAPLRETLRGYHTCYRNRVLDAQKRLKKRLYTG